MLLSAAGQTGTEVKLEMGPSQYLCPVESLPWGDRMVLTAKHTISVHRHWETQTHSGLSFHKEIFLKRLQPVASHLKGPHSSKRRKETEQLWSLNLRWLPHNTHAKASSFQELVFIIKVIFDVNKMPQLQKKLRTLQSQCKQSNGTPVIKKVIQITPKSN